MANENKFNGGAGQNRRPNGDRPFGKRPIEGREAGKGPVRRHPITQRPIVPETEKKEEVPDKKTKKELKQLEKSKKRESREVEIEEKPRFRIGGRIVLSLVCVSLTFFMLYLLTKQYDIQVIHYSQYSLAASRLHWKPLQEVPTRGDILDCNGNVLASTTYEYTIGITPNDVLKSQAKRDEGLSLSQIARGFSDILGVDVEEVEKALNKTDATYVQIAKHVSHETKKELSDFMSQNNLGGVAIDSDPKRYYTYNNLAAQVIGFADRDGNTLIGQYGIEAYYNTDLTGTKGYSYTETDNYNSGALPYKAPTSIEAVDGYNVELTLDMNIQRIAEEACRDAYLSYRPKDGVTCIVMDPYTGEIRAMVSMPDFNLNAPREMPFGLKTDDWQAMKSSEKAVYLMSNAWRNRCISDTYEPGSTLKAVTTAIALEEGLTDEEEYFSDAPIEVSSVDTISCWREHTDGNHGVETLRAAFENSCNPIFVQLAKRITNGGTNIDKYYSYIRNCGFYDVTGIDLPAEGKGIFHAQPTEVDLASLSFGESSTVTPLQLVSVYSALVNGGTLMKPHIVSRLTDNAGNIIREYEPTKVRTIFSSGTSKRVRSLMEDVVNLGTGAAGYVPGYYVAGKTSTSTIENGEDEGYHVLSFGCYAPSYDPKIAVLVVINKPADKQVGSGIAAKVSARIVEETLEYMDIPRKLTQKDYKDMTTLYHVQNDVHGKTFTDAKRILESEGYTVLDGSGTMEQDSIVGTVYYGDTETIYKNSVVVLYPGEVGKSEMNTTVIPNFTGMDFLECQRMAKEYGLNILVEGNIKGRVVSQDPPPTNLSAVTPTVTPTPTPGPGEEEGMTEDTQETTGETADTTPVETSAESTGETGDTENTDTSETGETTPPPPQRVVYGTVIKLVLE